MLFTLIDNWLTYVAYLRRNYVIICDRYFYHYVFPLNRVGGISRYLLEIYPRLIPKPDIVFLLDLPAEMAHERRPEAPISTYRRNREYYLKLAKQLNFIVINTSDQFTKVSSLVVNKVLSLLER
jgi:thymidylate kinase